MSRFWSSIVHQLSPYTPGEQPKLDHLVKLNTNENPYGPSPQVLSAIAAEASRLRLYPDPNADRLRQAVAEIHGILPGQVFPGNGSDEVLAHVFLGLLKHEAPVLFADVTYSFYPVYCRLYQIPFVTVPLDSEFKIRVADYLRPNGGVMLANPNAPTGCLLEVDEIEWLLRRNQESVVVVDEAYIDFGGQSVVPLLSRYDNLLVIHTLSKSRSLAGLRVGYAMGHPDLVSGLDRVKNCFNSYPLDRLAIAGAEAALRDRKHYETTRRAVMRTRQAMAREFGVLGFQVLPSAANFLFVRHPEHRAAELAQALRERCIIVRYFDQPRIREFLRISVGSEEDSRALLAALREIVGAPARRDGDVG